MPSTSKCAGGDDLPRYRITCEEFLKLQDYSASLPTGTTPGKMWRRLDGDFDLAFKQGGGQPRWMIGQYDPDCPTGAERIKIFWYRPIIVYRAAVPRVKLTTRAMDLVTFQTGLSQWLKGRKRAIISPVVRVQKELLRPEVREWLAEREIEPTEIVLNYETSDFETQGHYIGFRRSNEAFEYKMAWG